MGAIILKENRFQNNHAPQEFIAQAKFSSQKALRNA